MNPLDIANQFVRRIWRLKEDLCIEDIMLYGSLARNSENPGDVDLLFIHSGNMAFEEMQSLRGNNYFENNLELYCHFLDLLRLYKFPHEDVLSNMEEVKKAVSTNFLNVQFLDKRFFNDNNYKQGKIIVNEDSNFYENIFSDGLLWNQELEAFSIKAREKYNLRP